MNKAIFLDRDGVINEVLSKRVRFVNQPSDFYLLDGVGEAIKMLNDAQYHVFVVTNQGGIGLGYMSHDGLRAIHEKMKKVLSSFDAHLTDIAYCPHRPHAGCQCRKPEPEMINRLVRRYDIDVKKSYMIGDREPDIEAGKRAGMRTVCVGECAQVDAFMHVPNLLSFARWLVGM